MRRPTRRLTCSNVSTLKVSAASPGGVAYGGEAPPGGGAPPPPPLTRRLGRRGSQGFLFHALGRRSRSRSNKLLALGCAALTEQQPLASDAPRRRSSPYPNATSLSICAVGPRSVRSSPGSMPGVRLALAIRISVDALGAAVVGG